MGDGGIIAIALGAILLFVLGKQSILPRILRKKARETHEIEEETRKEIEPLEKKREEARGRPVEDVLNEMIDRGEL